jgi:hypothetical protein
LRAKLNTLAWLTGAKSYILKEIFKPNIPFALFIFGLLRSYNDVAKYI